MSLPAPNLDDRRFQQLVDEGKRYIAQRCPEWSDHNVSDPGVTLVETFAYMFDQLLYRLNRVPDRLYVKFLELIGVSLFPPIAARADVTFWLSAPLEETVRIPVGTEVATVRTETDELINYTVVEELPIVACHLERLASTVEANKVRDHSEFVEHPGEFYCFDAEPKPGDALLIGLSDAVPRCAITIRLDCEIEGVGVDPDDPPLRWEAWDGTGWSECEVERDGTGGLNRAGDVIMHVPKSHVASLIANQRAGWVRVRVIEPHEGQPTYGASPRIKQVEAFTIGGTTEAVDAEVMKDETLGLSEGVPGQEFPLKRRPVVQADEPIVVEVAAGDGWEEWDEVEDFSNSDVNDRHFVLNYVTGEVVFGPAVREPDGSVHYYGAVPPKAAPIRIRGYRTGGGRRGNVARGSIVVLKTSIPFVSKVENRRAAYGGTDPESIDQAKVRGPILLRTKDRAVTVEDYEQLAREAAPDIARVRCQPPAGEEEAAFGVRVLVVPSVPAEGLRFEQLVPTDQALERIRDYLDERKMIGVRLSVEPPVYQGVTVVARLRARPKVNPSRLQQDALDALYHYFHPLFGGPDGEGWPFGRPIHVGEVYAVLQQVRGTEFVEDARIFGANPMTGERGEAVNRIELGPYTLAFPYEHQVRVDAT